MAARASTTLTLDVAGSGAVSLGATDLTRGFSTESPESLMDLALVGTLADVFSGTLMDSTPIGEIVAKPFPCKIEHPFFFGSSIKCLTRSRITIRIILMK